MKVTIVVKPGWILERMARELVSRIRGVMIHDEWPPTMIKGADVAYFLPAKNVRYMKGSARRTVGFFTHGFDRTQAYWKEIDIALTMNRQMAKYLMELGHTQVRVIRPGTELPERPPIFGVVARVVERHGPKARKGLHLVKKAVEAGYRFVACTPNNQDVWPCPITHVPKRRDRFYRSIDYLVVTSTDEGGPMPAVEALAYRVPVIAPDVGWCWEFPVIHYERGSWESLEGVLRGLSHPPTWEEWAEGHRKVFAEIEKSLR